MHKSTRKYPYPFADAEQMPKQTTLARPQGTSRENWRAQAKWSQSEHFDLVTHRIPESDVERSLRAAGLPSGLALGHCPPPPRDGWVGRVFAPEAQIIVAGLGPALPIHQLQTTHFLPRLGLKAAIALRHAALP